MATETFRSERVGTGLWLVASQLLALWGKQSGLRRLIAVVVVGAVIAGVVWAVVGNRPAPLVTVASARDDVDAHDSVAARQRRGIVARMRGRDVEVARADLDRARGVLSAAGLPDATLGLRRFDDASPWQTGFAEQVNYKRGLQEELARSIKALAPIDGARVSIALGHRSIFKDQEQPPSASVALRARAGAQLDGSQVRGIQQLVASSIDGMRADDVTVIDSSGRLLTGRGAADATADDAADPSPDAQTQAQLKIERAVDGKVRTMLASVAGVGKVVVVSTAEVELERLAGGGDAQRAVAPVAVQQVLPPRESAAAAGGVAAPAVVAGSAATGEDADRAGWRLRRLHVAVLIEVKPRRGAAAAPPTEGELARWTALVRNAAAIDDSRGDRVDLTVSPWDAAAKPEAEATLAATAAVVTPGSGSTDAVPMPALAIASVVLCALLAVALVALIASRRRDRHRIAAAEQRAAELAMESASERPTRSRELRQRAAAAPVTFAGEAIRADVEGAGLVLSAWLDRDSAPVEEGAAPARARGRDEAVSGCAIGPRSAAVALLSLPEDLATSLLSKLEEAEIRQLNLAVSCLGEISEQRATEVLDELARNLALPLARTSGSAALRRLTQRAFGDLRAAQLLAAPPAAAPGPIDQLRAARVDDLAKLLSEEHPQIATLLLTQLPSPFAAQVLGEMNAEVAVELIARMAELRHVPPQVVAEASQMMAQMLAAPTQEAATDERKPFDGLTFAAALVRDFDPPRSTTLLDHLSERDRRTATRVRSALLAFKDLPHHFNRDVSSDSNGESTHGAKRAIAHDGAS
jgi:flagellar M-ring protein FliF